MFKTYFTAILLFVCLHSCQEETTFQSADLSARQLSNLHAFTRLYGYAHYFYPGTEASHIKWDNFAIYGAGKVMDARDDKELKEILLQLFKPIIPTLQLTDNGAIPALDTASLIPADTAGYQLTYWQHHGLTNDNHNVIFRYQRSQLLNQYNKILHRNDVEEYGVICNIPVKAYRNKMLKFSADLKCTPGSGAGKSILFLQPSNADGVYGGSTRSDPEKGDNKWHRREMFVRISPQADSMLLGVFLRTEGALYVDNCRVQVENGKEWMDIPVPNSNFERDTIGKRAAAWKNWPDDYDGTAVVATNDFAQGRQTLQINASTYREKSRFISRPLFDLRPHFNEAVQGHLSNTLAFSFPLVMYVTKGNAYPAADTLALNKLVDYITTAKPDSKQLTTRLADIIILWNTIQHGYIDLSYIGIDWEKAMDSYIAAAAKAHSFKEHYNGIKKLMADTKDGYMQMLAVNDMNPLYYLPVSIGWASGHLAVIKIDSEKDAGGLVVGDEIIEVNNKDALAYFSAEDSLTTYANASQLLAKRLYLIQLGDMGKGMKLKVKRKDNSTYTVVLPFQRQYSSTRMIDASAIKQPIRLVRPDVLYVYLGGLQDETVDSLAAHISPDIKYIIWDSRETFSSLHFLRFLMPVKDTLHLYYQSDIIYPDKDKRNTQAPSPYVFMNLGEAQKKRLHVNSVFLTEHSVKTYAEGALMYARNYHLGTIIGESTYGFGSAFNTMTLPGGIVVYVNALFAKDEQGRLVPDKGLKPDIEVWPTLQGIRDGKDEILDRAIQFAQTGK